MVELSAKFAQTRTICVSLIESAIEANNDKGARRLQADHFELNGT